MTVFVNPVIAELMELADGDLTPMQKATIWRALPELERPRCQHQFQIVSEHYMGVAQLTAVGLQCTSCGHATRASVEPSLRVA